MRLGRAFSLVVLLLSLCAGCSSGGLTPGGSLEPAGPSATNPLSAVSALIPKTTQIVGSPTEVYTRVARGVLTCWFGAGGPLKSTHIYNANAEPASKGGQSEIEIFEKDTAAPDPRSLRAFRVEIKTIDGATKVETENVKIAEPLASRLMSDVDRWAADEGGCGDEPVTEGWAAGSVTKVEPESKNADAPKARKAKKP